MRNNNTGSVNESVNDDNTVFQSSQNGQESQNVSCRHDLITEIDDEQKLTISYLDWTNLITVFDIEIDGCDLAKYCELLQGNDSNSPVFECSMADNIPLQNWKTWT